MRRRLISSYLLLLALILLALEVPFGISIADRATDRMVADRVADATRLASLAEPALRTGQLGSLADELGRYDQVYGIIAVLVDQSGVDVISSRPGVNLPRYHVSTAEHRALAGVQADDAGPLWPWRAEPVVVAVPVGSGGEVLGALLTISPTDRQVAQVRFDWMLLAVGGLGATAVGILAAWLFARWTLRPVAVLDAAAHVLGSGDYEVRVPAGAGPPELRRLAGTFNEMAGTVADVLDRQRAFVSQASHQLRNPLTALRLRVEDLGADLTGPDAVEGHRLALEEVQRLADVLDSLLALARAERGKLALEPVDAGETAWARVVAWQPVATVRQVRLRYVRPPYPLRALAVANALDQSLDALIDNAVKFSGPAALVTVRITEEDAGVAVHVTDTGPGMTAAQRARATERFWRAPDAQNVDGSGLGLPIVAVLAEASGGRLDLLPHTPSGLHARVWLPAA